MASGSSSSNLAFTPSGNVVVFGTPPPNQSREDFEKWKAEQIARKAELESGDPKTFLGWALKGVIGL